MCRRKAHTNSDGQGIVEFALVVPIFLALTFGVIELGWLVYNNHTLSNATREGARYAMVNGARADEQASIGSVQAVVDEYTGGLTGTVEVTNVDFTGDAEVGDDVTVATTYNYQPIVGVITGIGSITLTSESTVIVQY